MKSFHLNTLLVITAMTLPLASMAEGSLGGDNAAKVEKLNEMLTQRFQKADTDQDGTVTLEEAKSGMPRVYKNFQAIDTAGAGKLSLDQIKQYMLAQMEAKKGTRP